MIEFAFLLGVVFISFNLIWVFFTFLLKQILGATGNVEKYILRITQGYFLASVTALATLNYEESSDSNSRIYLIVGAFVLFFYLINKMEQRKKRLQFSMQFNREQVNFKPENLKFDILIAIVTVGLFVVSYLNPNAVQTPINIWIFTQIESILGAFFIGWIIKVIGVFFIIGIFFSGINTIQTVYNQLSNMINGKSKNTSGNSEEFTDFEFVEEELEDNLIE